MAKKTKDKKIIKGAPLNHNAALQRKYKAALEALTKPMTRETKTLLMALFKDEKMRNEVFVMQAQQIIDRMTVKWDKIFGAFAQPLATQMVDAQVAAGATTLAASLKKMASHLQINTGIIPRELSPKLDAIVKENVGLIKSIPKQYLTQVQGDVMRSVTTEEGVKSLRSSLLNYEGMTERRAKNIALDQTRKTYNVVNIERSKAVGLTKGIWLHSGGGQKPRPYHIELNGTVFEFADPPVIDLKTGERGFPGQLPNCGCSFEPIYEFND